MFEVGDIKHLHPSIKMFIIIQECRSLMTSGHPMVSLNQPPCTSMYLRCTSDVPCTAKTRVLTILGTPVCTFVS